jgi:hypothetical protein
MLKYSRTLPLLSAACFGCVEDMGTCWDYVPPDPVVVVPADDGSSDRDLECECGDGVSEPAVSCYVTPPKGCLGDVYVYESPDEMVPPISIEGTFTLDAEIVETLREACFGDTGSPP